MTDIEKMENTAVENAKVEEEKQPDEAVKTYTQSEVDNIVKARLSRANEKSKKQKQEMEEARQSVKTAKVLSKILTKAGFEGTAEEQAQAVGKYYGMSEDEVSALLNEVDSGDKSEKQALAYINAKRFIEQSDEDDLAEEWERIKDIPESKRNLNDREMFNALKPKMSKKTAEKQSERMKNLIAEDKKWFKENVGDGFEKFIKSKQFNEFMEGTSMTVRTAMEKYVSLRGVDSVKEEFSAKDNPPASTGSAKDSGTSKLKDYYSPEDYDKLTDKDLDNPEIFNRVRESMTKWK